MLSLGELHGVEAAAGGNGRLLLRLHQEMIGEATAALRAGVDEVRHLDDPVRLAAGLAGGRFDPARAGQRERRQGEAQDNNACAISSFQRSAWERKVCDALRRPA